MFNFLKKRKGGKRLPGKPAVLRSAGIFRYKGWYGVNSSLRGWFTYDINNRSSFYRYLRDSIPLIRNAVETWVRILNTSSRIVFTGNEYERRKAEIVVKELNERIGLTRGRSRAGIEGILNVFFREIFTVGSFSGMIVLNKELDRIEYFNVIDRDRIRWKREDKWEPYYIDDDGNFIHIGKSSFFHYGYGADAKNPGGVSPMSSISLVNELDQRMLYDMGLSSHNVGNPRIHIKIKAPEPFENEDAELYTKRAESYFEEIMKNFENLDVMDNIFSWDDVEIQVVGGKQSMGFTWKVNREALQEDIICGMGLYPWVVGKSHGTTKNWVEAQFNLLMQEADTLQMEGKALAEFILNTELSLWGIDAKANFEFNPNQDPYLLEKQKAKEIQVRIIDLLIRRGYISREEGMRKLGTGNM